jgi:hypothetical protein
MYVAGLARQLVEKTGFRAIPCVRALYLFKDNMEQAETYLRLKKSGRRHTDGTSWTDKEYINHILKKEGEKDMLDLIKRSVRHRFTGAVCIVTKIFVSKDGSITRVTVGDFLDYNLQQFNFFWEVL